MRVACSGTWTPTGRPTSARTSPATATRSIALLADWVAGHTAAAEARAVALAARFPHELAAVKLAQYLAFNRGDAPAMLRAILAVLPANAHNAHAHGMAADEVELQCG